MVRLAQGRGPRLCHRNWPSVRPADDAAVSDAHYDDDDFRFAYFIDDAVLALSQSVAVVARQLLAARWSRILGQRLNPPRDTLAVSFGGNSEQFFLRRALDQDPIFSHCA